jgi:hypothetical protein
MNSSGRRAELKCEVPRAGSLGDSFRALTKLIADRTQGSEAVSAAIDRAVSEIDGLTRM